MHLSLKGAWTGVKGREETIRGSVLQEYLTDRWDKTQGREEID